MSGWGSAPLLGLGALVLGACGPAQLSINVKSPVGTNMGRPLYMLVRQVDSKQYANEAYSEVAARVGAPDATVLQTSVIYPGTIQRFQVKAPKESAVALSFLFTAPDGNWQVLLSPPLSSAPVDVELSTGRILNDPVSNKGGAAGDEAPGLPEAPKAPDAPKLPEAPKAPEAPKLPGGQ